MLALAGSARFFFFREPIDLRKGFEGLGAIVDANFSCELFCGSYFIFLNKGRNRMKVLYWDLDGLVIWHKRLEKGSFSKRDLEGGRIERRDFLMLLEGITPKRIQARHRE